MKFSTLKFFGFCGALSISSAVMAVDLGSGYQAIVDTTLGSDYRVKGISQTSNKPGIQSSVILMSPLGLYTGAYVANVEFGDYKTRLEHDYIAGAYIPLSESISLNVSYIDINYKDTKQFNFSGFWGELTAYGAKVGIQYMPASMAEYEQTTVYSYAEYSHSLPFDLLGTVHYGYLDNKDDVFWSRDFTARSAYNEWFFRLTKPVLGFDFSVTYNDNDLSKTECSSYYGEDNICSAALNFSVNKKF